ncbi:hypothetical protein ONE63_011514 [Megalurothrips usitatus]|uniref:BEN domain-containing protein n=1 Tax=Megalurothrips usitatus TaxID=439358 RepID=A0AAV7X295_9NEOP|nr:hypothetical protein ONE63_011514 [Megalurothrips usitatus]
MQRLLNVTTRKWLQVKKDKEQDKVHKESEGRDGKTEVLELEVKGSSKVEDKEAEHVLIDHNERDEIIIDKGVTTSSNDNSQCTGISNEDTSSKDNDKASNVPDNLKCSKKCKERVKSLQEKVDSCTDKYRQMKRKVIKLETENKLLKDQSQGLLTQLSKEIKKIPGKINNNAFQSSICKVKSIALEEQFSEVSWNEETEIYVGEGKVITRKAVDVIDDQLTSFNSRGVALLELMLDDKLSNYSKTGHSGSGETLKCIPKTHITALKKIMRSMSWGYTSEDCSDKKFRDFLNKQPNEERRKLERKATGGKSKVGQKGNPKQKKAVKRDSEDISSETTSNKKSKVIEESDEDSLSDEKETSNKKSKVNEESDEDALSDEKETPEDLDSSNFLLNYSTSSET